MLYPGETKEIQDNAISVHKHIKRMFRKHLACSEHITDTYRYDGIRMCPVYYRLNLVYWYSLSDRPMIGWLHYFIYDGGTLPPETYDYVAKSTLYSK